MKVKYRQLYSNDCGIAAIKNLLFLNKISFNNDLFKCNKNGISTYSIKKYLLNYFKKVDIISFDINQLKKVKNFKPYISLIKINEIGHYVVVYKKTKQHLYILDSLYERSYKIKYEDFKKIDGNVSILVDDKSDILIKDNKITYKIVLVLLSFIESLFLLSTTVLIQQIIDNSIKDAFLYCIIQLFILIIGKIKINMFIKQFQSLDKELVSNTMYKIYNLKLKYVNNHNLDEIYYRLNDSYLLKSMKLNFYYNFINDIVLLLLSFILIFFYSLQIGFLMILICILIFIYSYHVFKKSEGLIENKRKKEYEFFNNYRDSFNYKEKIYKSKDNSFYESSHKKLSILQSADLKYEKYQLNKNYTLLTFQTIINCILVIIYFTTLYNYISIGSLIALINIINIILQPFLNICSNLTMYSNYKLIITRLEDINKSH